MWALLLAGLLCATPAAAQNLLPNPGFEAGNTGFNTAYTYIPPPTADPGPGNYTIGTDNRAFNPNFLASYGDHTTGTGRYMIVNASLVATTNVWQRNVTGLQPNQSYQFSFWLLNTFPTSKARIQVAINGTNVGAPFTNPNDGGVWQLNTLTVNTGAGTSLDIRLRNVNTDSNGNDFGLDDMSLTAPPVANPQLTVNDVTTASISTTAVFNATQISPLSATITGPAGATVATYTLASVPSVGTLRVGNGNSPALAAGAVLTTTQASQLYYTPGNGATQNLTFAYSATDSNGNFSANSATYTIPLVSPAAPVGCGPAYGGGPSSSGLAADYYPGYFNDNLAFFNSTAPGLTRIDPQLNFASSSTTAANGWGTIIPPAIQGATATDPDQFSTRHRGSVYIPTAGAYTFYLTSDDASYLWLDGAALAPTLANATINNGGAHGPRLVQATATLSAGLHNILVYYGEATGGNTLTLEYSSAAGAGISQQIIPNSALCAGPSPQPPVATAVTNAPAMPSTNAPTAVQALAGSDPNAGGSVTNYRIASLPTAASGILYLDLGATVVTAGQVLTAAQAAGLSFDPEPGFSGNATFTFFAINNAGIASNLPATYTIPVVGPVADVTTTVSGPTTLGAGVSSGTFTATFTNNGPQSATQVTQQVRLPTGASMTASQQAALPSTATYNSGTNTIVFATVPVLNSGAANTNTYTFTFTSPTTQGANSLVSTVGTSTSQGANAAADQATFSVNVTPGNFFVTNDDSNEIPGNASKSGNVILNDANPANLANSGFTATRVSNPTHGTLVFNADGSYAYTPTNGYLGPDSFTYQVCVPTANPPCSNVSTVALNVYDANLVCTIGTGTNQLTNPSFTNGNTGFTSSYGFVNDNPGVNDELIPEALYAVGNNAFNYHPSFAGAGRLGAGDNFMIVNGSQNLSVVYQQTITVKTNTYYSFSAYANSVNPQSGAQLGFVINGKSTSSVTTLDGTTSYTRFSDLWFSGNNTTAVIEIRDVNKDPDGNDFGLDDLYFGTCAKGLTANNVTNRMLSNSAASTGISALRGTVTTGPPLEYFTIQTLPSTTAGILYLNNAPVVPGQVIPLAQAGQLFFDPVAGYVGTGTFTYTATDDSGAGSDNVATYSMPIDNRPLPVELVSFGVKVVRAVDAQLNWRTASELNNDHFEVQRSTDGLAFKDIARVAVQGTTSSATAYAHTDAGIGAALTGPVYYRLRQVDRDGASSYSPVQAVSFSSATAGAIALFPNPATAITRLDLSLLPAGTYQVRVLDNVGRQVLTAAFSGGGIHPLDLRTVANGTYVVLVRGTNGQQFAKRLVKE